MWRPIARFEPLIVPIRRFIRPLQSVDDSVRPFVDLGEASDGSLETLGGSGEGLDGVDGPLVGVDERLAGPVRLSRRSPRGLRGCA